MKKVEFIKMRKFTISNPVSFFTLLKGALF